MKKITKIVTLTTIIAASFSFANQASAKTQGSYLGAAIIKSETANKYKIGSVVDSRYVEFKNSETGLNLNYQYALNFNGLFISPELFYDYLNNKAIDSTRDSVKLKARYGAKINIGFDVTDNFAPYLTAGLARTSYEIKFANIGITNDRKVEPVYGFGFNFYPHKDVAINFEYNMQKLDKLTTPVKNYTVDSRVDVIKLGAAYHF